MGAGLIARLFQCRQPKHLENGVSGGDTRSTGVTGSITCTFNVAAGFDIVLSNDWGITKGEVLFIEKKDGTIVIAGSQLGALAITLRRRQWGNYREI
jgi:hypothetical protein